MVGIEMNGNMERWKNGNMKSDYVSCGEWSEYYGDTGWEGGGDIYGDDADGGVDDGDEIWECRPMSTDIFNEKRKTFS